MGQIDSIMKWIDKLLNKHALIRLSHDFREILIKHLEPQKKAECKHEWIIRWTNQCADCWEPQQKPVQIEMPNDSDSITLKDKIEKLIMCVNYLLNDK